MAEVRRTACSEAQSMLYRRHWFRLVALARRYAGEIHGAEDLASEAIVRTLRRLCAGAEISSFPRYAQMVARNLHIDAQRGRLTLVLVDDFYDEGADTVSPRDEIADVDLTLELAALLARLGPRHREILTLTLLQDMPTQVAAAVMGIKPNAAASLALRARTALRAAYLEQTGEDRGHGTTGSRVDAVSWLPGRARQPRPGLVATDATR